MPAVAAAIGFAGGILGGILGGVIALLPRTLMIPTMVGGAIVAGPALALSWAAEDWEFAVVALIGGFTAGASAGLVVGVIKGAISRKKKQVVGNRSLTARSSGRRGR